MATFRPPCRRDWLAFVCIFTGTSVGPLFAAPTAINDSYSTREDTTLVVEGLQVLGAAFDGGVAPFPIQWNYLNNLSNAAASTYPADGTGKDWKVAAFNVATSTVGPWRLSPLPMIGQTASDITYYNSHPEITTYTVLTGGAGVTTYLFRNTWTLTAAQAAMAQWTVHYLFDDAAVVYLNGAEAFRVNMPTGAVNPRTLASTTGNEGSYTDLGVNLAGKLVTGVNTIAVEVHETSVADAAFDLTLSAQDTGGFTYTADGLGTSANGFNTGNVDTASGFENTGALHITAGARTATAVLPISGLWARSFSVNTAGTYSVTFKYHGVVTPHYDANEFIEGVFRVDNVRYGDVPASGTLAGSGASLYRFVGNGNGLGAGEAVDTGWQTFTRTFTLSAGAHTINFGLYNSTSSGSSGSPETSDLYIDDVSVVLIGGGTLSGVLLNDSGTATRTAVKDSDPSHGSLALNSNGSFTYIPAANFNGQDSFAYHAVDETGTSAPATVSITVTPQPDPPVASDDAYSTTEDTVLNVNAAAGVLANDSDPDGETLTAAVRADPAHGAVTLSSNGSFAYTPTANYSGTDSFTYRVGDGTSFSEDRTVTVTITPVNDPPATTADSYYTLVNTPLPVTLLSSAGQPATTQILVPPGFTIPLGDPTETDLPVWRYLDNGSNQGTTWRTVGFNDSAWATGRAEFGYGDVTDGRPERTVVGYGPDPNARFATTYFRTTFKAVGISSISGLGIRLMRDDAAAVYLNGTEIYRDRSANGFPNLAANPAYNAYASASISGVDEGLLVDLTQYLSADAVQNLGEGTNTLAVEIHQSAANSTDISMDIELSAQRVPYAGVLANDTDPDNQPVTVQLVTAPVHGTLNLNSDGTFLYTPAHNYIGPDSFVYKASDGSLESVNTTVNLTVAVLGNVPPEAGGDTFSVNEDTLLTIGAPGVLINDSDLEGSALTAQRLTNPLHGALVFNANGSFTYTPALNYHGPDSFTYRARDASSLPSLPATVSLTINSVNDAPVAVADTYGTNPGQTLTVSAAQGVLANDADAEGTQLSAQIVAGPATGTLNLQSSGAFEYIPAAGFSGAATFTYKASDGSSVSATTVVTINVNGAPTAVADAYSVVEDTALHVNAAGVLSNDSDPENSALTAQVVMLPLHGSLTFNANGSFSYLPASDYTGADSFTYVANDGVRQSPPASVSLTITPVNDAPLAVDDSYRAIPNKPLIATAASGLLSNDRDAEGTALTLIPVSNPAHGTLALSPDGSFTYTPVSDFTGTDSFLYKVSDGSLTSANATVVITVAQTSEDVVINEIMFRPGSGFPEVTSREFIELYNRGTRSIDLSGWKIDSGVNFTFPAGRIMAPGSYLVVAANVAAFQTAYPGVANVVGGWTGTLSNSGESIALIDAAGEALDEVQYSTEGDWASRIREGTWGGWDWSTLADAGGRSLELRNPNLGNGNGQNWAVSTTIGGTPGTANGALSTNIPPVVKSVKHTPAVPLSTDRVVISCEVEDESPLGPVAVTLFTRDATTASPPGFVATAMSSDGKGGWFATVDPKPHLSVVEFFIAATDGTVQRFWPAPTTEGQNANCQYQVDDTPSSAFADGYRLILTTAENEAFNGIANSSDRQFNATLVVTRGAETSIRYCVSMRIRGNSSRSYQIGGVPARPLRISISNDDLDGVSRFNLQPRSSYTQHLGMRLFQAAGIRTPDTIPVELRRNGVKLTTSSGTTPDYGYWTRLEDIGSEMVSRHWPLSGGGGVYKKGRNDYYWRATEPAPATPDGVLDGWIKQNNSAANDWTDLTTFFSVWQAATVPHFPGTVVNNTANGDGSSKNSIGSWAGTAFTTEEMDSLGTVADFDQWARWFAVMTILQDFETNVSNGQDDDYGAYFEPRNAGGGSGQRRLQFIPHDLDTIFGLGDTVQPYNARGLYDSTDQDFIFRPLLPLLGNATVAGNADFRSRYLNAVRELLGTVFDADTTANPNPPFHAFVDYQLGGWAPDSTRTAIKEFMRQRRQYLLGLIGAPATVPPAGTSNATVTSTHGPLLISEVLASNVTAHPNGTLFPDVVELYNEGGSALDLGGKSLTDDPLAKTKYVFPSGATLAAGGFLVLYADSETASPGTHLGFGLNADGDRLFLYDSAANGQALLDTVTFGLQVSDLSIGRTGPGLNAWALCTPTTGAANTAVASLAAPAGVRINEWLGNADYLTASDFIELANPADEPVALGGMSLTDDPVNRPFRGTLPPLSFMAAHGFVVFEAKSSEATPGNARELPFGLDSTTGSVALIGVNGTTVDRADTVSQFRDVSTGRLPDGTGTWTRLSPPSPGFSNAALPETTGDVLHWLRITELMYNPASSDQSEFIELRNTSDLSETPVTLDLSGVAFTNGITYTFPQGTSLAPGAYLVLAGEPGKFQAQFPAVSIGGVFTGKFDNAGESVRLDIAGFNVAILDFKFSDGWYPSTDGGGDSLQIVNPAALPAQWDKKSGWQGAPPSPGTGPAFGVYAGPDLSAVAGERLFLSGTLFTGAFQQADVSVIWSSQSGPGAVTFTTANYKEANAFFAAPGSYVLRFAASAPGPLTAADTLTVSVTDSFASWTARLLTGQPLASRQPSADPDGDGMVNLAEFVLGGDPQNLSSSGRPQASLENGRLVLTWHRDKFADPAVRIIPQISEDLLSWQEGAAVLSVTLVASTASDETWKATELLPPGTRRKAAMRLRILMDQQ